MQVRAASPDDAPEIVDVRLTSWRATYDYIPLEAFEAVDVSALVERAARRITGDTIRTLVAVRADRIVGYADVGASRDDDLSEAGEIYSIYVVPAHWSTGVGRALLPAALAELATPVTVLWVLEDNARARRFYEIAGFVADGARKQADLLGGLTRPEIRYRHG